MTADAARLWYGRSSAQLSHHHTVHLMGLSGCLGYSAAVRVGAWHRGADSSGERCAH